MSEELNVGQDWEQSKKLVVFWRKKWAKAEDEKRFVIQYLNPCDTSFREMINNFMKLSETDKDKIIKLAQSMKEIYD